MIANTYMGRLGNAALERYQQLNKQLYPTLDAHSKRGSTPPSSAQNSPAGTPRESGTAVNPQQPSSPDAPKVRVGSGPDGLTHFGLVGSPSYPDIASDKGSFKSNTPKHVRRRHSDSDSEDLNKVLQRVEKPQLENVEEDVSSGPTSEPQTDTSISSGHRPHGGSNSNIVPSSPTKSQPNETFARRTVEVRRKKPILKGDNHRKSLNRVSFDPLALLLDASLEGELELVMRTAKEVSGEGLQYGNNNSNNNNYIQRRNLRYFTISSLCRELTISSLCHELSPTNTLKWLGCNRAQITFNTSGTYHVQRVVFGATWYEGKAQLLSLTELKSHLFWLYFIG